MSKEQERKKAGSERRVIMIIITFEDKTRQGGPVKPELDFLNV